MTGKMMGMETDEGDDDSYSTAEEEERAAKPFVKAP